MPKSILDAYEDLLAAGELKPDPAQHEVLISLDRLQHDLAAYKPAAATGIMGKLFGKSKSQAAPRGLYIHGHVGRGKTMLMDLFHDTLQTDAKLRSHFNDFMQSVHTEVHDIRRHQQEGKLWEDADPIRIAGERIAKRARIVCFDEFQVSDITDAMILGRLFEALFQHGVVIIATSNVEPDNLYKDGLNRNAFVPFIAVLKAGMQVMSLDSPTDYRIGRLAGRRVFLHPLDAETARELDQLWNDVTDSHPGESGVVHVKGREVPVPRQARGVARFHFDDLCRANLGAADYIAIATAFSTVFLDAIPVLTRNMHNEAKRFITLIDTLYDRRIRFVARAAAEPEALYSDGPHTFAFARTVSRLTEMRSAGYWSRS